MIRIRPAMLVSLTVATTATIGAGGALAAPAEAPNAAPAATDFTWRTTTTSTLAPGVSVAELAITTAAGPSQGHLTTVDLTAAGVSTDLLTAPSVGQRQPIDTIADRAGALAAVNADYFNISEEASHAGVSPTNSAVGAEIRDGVLRKSAVPMAQRFGEGPSKPVNDGTQVIGVDHSGRASVGSVRFTGTLHSSGFLRGANPAAVVSAGDRRGAAVVPLNGLNQYGFARNQIGVFTTEWGAVSRARAACGSEVARRDPCASNVTEVIVRNKRVVSVSSSIGAGQLPDGTVAVVGREQGADLLRKLRPGDVLQASWRADTSAPYSWAVGAAVTGVDGATLPGLNKSPAPRTAAGVSADGRTLLLLVVDGRRADSVGVSTLQTAELLLQAGADDTVTLDGGGSSALVARTPDEPAVRAVNQPSDGTIRPVPNGIGVFWTQQAAQR